MRERGKVVKSPLLESDDDATLSGHLAGYGFLPERDSQLGEGKERGRVVVLRNDFTFAMPRSEKSVTFPGDFRESLDYLVPP